MAKARYIQKGDIIDYINGSGAAIAYNDVVPLVTRVGVAAENIAVGATGSMRVTGVHEMPAVTTVAFAVGDQLYWDATAGKLTKTSTDNTPAGWCVETKAQAGTLGVVKIG